MNSIKIYMLAGVICLCILAGCQGEEATPTKAVLFAATTPDLQATIDAAVEQTQAAEVTDTPAPTNTTAPTDTPEPTDTLEPTPTKTSAPASEGLHKQLAGTWTSDIMTVTFDWEAGTYSGVGLGELFERKLTLVSEEANIVVFKADESTIVCQFMEDGSILLRKQVEGGIPVILTRASSEAPALTIPATTEAPDLQKAAEIIQSHAFKDSDNTAHIIGVIENQGNVPLEFVKVVATLTDADGNFLDTDFTYTVHDIVWPGEKVPFSLYFHDISTDISGYDLTLEGDSVHPAEVTEISEGLEIIDSAAKWSSYAYEIGGIVANNTDQPVEFVKIIGVLYDTNGHIMGTDFTYTTLDVIPPDGESPFELYRSRDNMAALDPEGNLTEIGSYELTVEGEPLD